MKEEEQKDYPVSGFLLSQRQFTGLGVIDASPCKSFDTHEEIHILTSPFALRSDMMTTSLRP